MTEQTTINQLYNLRSTLSIMAQYTDVSIAYFTQQTTLNNYNFFITLTYIILHYTMHRRLSFIMVYFVQQATFHYLHIFISNYSFFFPPQYHVLIAQLNSKLPEIIAQFTQQTSAHYLQKITQDIKSCINFTQYKEYCDAHFT